MKHSPKYLVLVLLMLGVAMTGAAQVNAPSGVPKIVYVTVDYDTRTYTLFAADPDGSNTTALVTGGQYWSAVVSPDGRRLAFIGKKLPAGTTAIYVMGMDGTNLRVVTPPPSPVRVRPVGIAWFPDSVHIMYGGEDSGGGTSFYTFEVDSVEQVRVRFPDIPDEHRTYGQPMLSPDGTQVAVHGAGETPDGTLYLANADGSGAVPYAAKPAVGESYFYVAWSPDGTQVVLDALTGFDFEARKPLVIANADGSNLRPVAGDPPNFPNSPSWSPDGRQVLFVANEPGVESKPGGELFVVNADGSNLHALGIAEEIAPLGTWWATIPDDVTLPSAPVDLADATRRPIR